MKAALLLFCATCCANTIFDQYDATAKKIVSEMSLAEKIGQMILPTFDLLTNQKGEGAMEAAIAAWPHESDVNLYSILGFDAIEKYHLGAALQAGGPITYSGEEQGEKEWQKLSTIAQHLYSGPGGTPFIIGNDAIHGDQHVPGRILFPHNIGLGATHNPELVKQVATDTMLNLLASGYNWSFMPSVSIGKDYRWGRFYESFSATAAVVRELSKAYIEGLQAISDKKITGVLATAKHFIGDGDTENGVDEGYSTFSTKEQLWNEAGAGYEGAVDADVATIMASYNSVNDIPMHFGGAYDILNQFRNVGIKGFEKKTYALGGFVVSDFLGLSRAAYKYNKIHEKKIDYIEAIAMSINGGVDMFMIGNGAYIDPFQYDPGPPFKTLSPLYFSHISTVIEAIKEALTRKLLSHKRLDDAVTRIIRTKLTLQSMPGKAPAQDQANHALEAAKQSLVLLKNEKNTLPLKKSSIQNVFFLGAYDDIGSQNGGWTVNWQGQKGNGYWAENSREKKSAHATSVLDGMQAHLPSSVRYFKGEDEALFGHLDRVNGENSVAIVVLAEYPYAEYNGDVANDNPWYYRGAASEENAYTTKEQRTFLGIQLTKAQTKAISRLKKRGVPIITILFSGRPVVITEGEGAPLPISESFIAAFLPGTSGGEAIAEALFGTYIFKSVKNTIDNITYYSNTLPFAWPATMEEVKNHTPSLFPIGYGLP